VTKKTRKHVAIVGGAPSWEGAPFDDPEWEVWSISAMWNQIPQDKVHKWFELHNVRTIEERPEEAYPGLKSWLFKDKNRSPLVIFEGFGIDATLNSEFYPRQKIETRFGKDWWSSTIAWMLGLALEESEGKIGLFGVEMCMTEEYGDQQAALRHFRDIALLMGRDVIFPSGCNMLHPVPVYPDIETPGHLHCLREVERLTNEKAIIASQIKALCDKSSHVDGAIEAYQHLIRNNWV
jgi:hypothetical protein